MKAYYRYGHVKGIQPSKAPRSELFLARLLQVTTVTEIFDSETTATKVVDK